MLPKNQHGSNQIEASNEPVNLNPYFPWIGRPRRKLTGLLNQGGTCYLNTLLQTLLHTPEFTFRLFNLTRTVRKENLKRMIIEMLNLFSALITNDGGAVSSKPLTDSFGWTEDEVCVHQDIQELNRLLFEQIEIALKDTPETNLINDLFRGVQCTRDEFQDINLSVIEYDSVEASLSAHTQMERLSGDNQYFCDGCRTKVDAIKMTRFDQLPPILTLSLSRFYFDARLMQSVKVEKLCSFPIILDMSNFLINKPKNKVKYDLFSIVLHVGGSTGGGHYHAFIKDPYGTIRNDLKDSASASDFNAVDVFFNSKQNNKYPEPPNTSPLIIPDIKLDRQDADVHIKSVNNRLNLTVSKTTQSSLSLPSSLHNDQLNHKIHYSSSSVLLNNYHVQKLPNDNIIKTHQLKNDDQKQNKISKSLPRNYFKNVCQTNKSPKKLIDNLSWTNTERKPSFSSNIYSNSCDASNKNILDNSTYSNNTGYNNLILRTKLMNLNRLSELNLISRQQKANKMNEVPNTPTISELVGRMKSVLRSNTLHDKGYNFLHKTGRKISASNSSDIIFKKETYKKLRSLNKKQNSLTIHTSIPASPIKKLSKVTDAITIYPAKTKTCPSKFIHLRSRSATICPQKIYNKKKKSQSLIHYNRNLYHNNQNTQTVSEQTDIAQVSQNNSYTKRSSSLTPPLIKSSPQNSSYLGSGFVNHTTGYFASSSSGWRSRLFEGAADTDNFNEVIHNQNFIISNDHHKNNLFQLNKQLDSNKNITYYGEPMPINNSLNFVPSVQRADAKMISKNTNSHDNDILSSNSSCETASLSEKSTDHVNLNVKHLNNTEKNEFLISNDNLDNLINPNISEFEKQHLNNLVKTNSPMIEELSEIVYGRWFDINDDYVAEIDPSTFERVFEGPECAYMLFYRLMNLPLPVP